MIQISGLQLLYKQEGIFESIVSSKTKIVMTVNLKDTYTSQQEKQNNKLVKWPDGSLPQIPVGDNLSNFQLDFKFIKSQKIVGKAKSFMVLGHSRKDCLDVVDDKFSVVGKFLYEGKWIYGYSQNQYNVKPQAYLNNIGETQDIGLNYPDLQQISQTKKKNKKSKKKQSSDQGSGLLSSLFTCCSSKRRPKRKQSLLKCANILIDYRENQIQPSKNLQMQCFSVQYYSKKKYNKV